MKSLMLLASGYDLVHAPNTMPILFVYCALCFTTCNLRCTLCTVSNSEPRWFPSVWLLECNKTRRHTLRPGSPLTMFSQLMSHDTCS